MKHIKYFENLLDIAYSVGDTVICVKPEFDTVGSKYKINRIYTPMAKLELTHITNYKRSSRDIMTEVTQLSTGNIYENIWCDRFLSEIEYNKRKFNI